MNLASYIDHTLLKPEATVDDILRLCAEAAEHNFAAVCVNPCYVSLAAHRLAGSGVKVATVVGFPLGATLTAVKAVETQAAVEHKADEIDMVMNIGAAKAGQWTAVADDIRTVVRAAEGRVVKVIIEAALLTDEEKERACLAILEAGAQFVKTSTGFGPGGATEADVRLLARVAGGKLGIKAAGGIRTREQALPLIAAGATRIGTSAGVNLVK
ncbi:deoxyribose-phosphate aldolase [Sporolituus thermophilus]|uniref:deoxyribose-phosphate aldolase n=1 Tax=Sporolituus thermophilus TaxID=608505 RepID=UPI001C0B2646|nr:deoxyribose-phosphate aldolase [Sporolituus thermophilus]